MTSPFGDLPRRHFELVLADPPWFYATRSAKGRGRSADRHYPVMPLDEIKALPVGDLCARNCLLWLWATWAMMPQALAVMEAWGFRYATGAAWAKRSKADRGWAFGTGYVLRNASEPFLIGVRGRPAYGPDCRRVRGLIVAPVQEHSRKPDQQYDMLDTLVPGVPRIELFARSRRPGWMSWGNETDRFPQPQEANP